MTRGRIDNDLVYKDWFGADGRRNRVNPYEMVRSEIDNPDYGTASGYVVNGNILFPQGIQEAEAAAQNICVRQLREQAAEIDTYAFMRDLPETVGLIETRLSQMLKIARSLKKGDIKAIKKLFKGSGMHSIPAAWLEFNFVLKPTYHDILTFSHVLDHPPPLIQMKTFGKQKGSDGNAANYMYGTFEVKCALEMAVRGINPNMALAQRLGALQPLATIWELSPWSWAADYLANVGEIVGNFEPHFLGYDIAYIRRSRVRKVERDFGHPTFIPGEPVPYVHSKSVWMRRDRLAEVPDITLELGGSLNLKQFSYLSSAIALTLRGKFRS